LPRLSLDPSKPKISVEEKSALQDNIQLLRDAIVLFSATSGARGVGGHTGESGSQVILISIQVCSILGGAYNAVPEVCKLFGLFEGSDRFYPVVFDEAGTKLTFDD